jgi:hypothetical protein
MTVPWWYMKREWLDQEPGIDSVYIHYTCTPYEMGPDWEHYGETRLMEQNAVIKEGMGGTILVELSDAPVHERPSKSPPHARIRVLKCPTRIWDPRTNRQTENFLFHHYFEVHQNGKTWNTEVFTEEIVCREVELVDEVGNVWGTCAHWSLYDDDATQYVPAEVDGFIQRYGEDNEFRSYKYYTHPDRGRFPTTKTLMTREIPMPHRWRSKMWGPRGAQVIQGWHVGYLDHIPSDWEQQPQVREEWTGYQTFTL